MQATNYVQRVRGRRSKRPKRAVSQFAHLRSPCPIANLLDLAGDKWSLLVVRDLLRGRSRFSELVDSPEGIPTNILADRLKKLEKAGVLLRTPYQKGPVRYSYQLTKKGRDLRNVLSAVIRWSKKHIPDVRTFADLDFEMKPSRISHTKQTRN